jgi:alpha-L-rhamnosidase
VVDVGVNLAGWCRYRFPASVKAGTNVSFLHAERLNGNGTITHAIQPLTAGAFEQTVYTFGEPNASDWVFFEPVFVSYGFRYVQITGPLPVAPGPEDICCWWIHTDLAPTGRFQVLEERDPRNESALGEAATSSLAQALVANYNQTMRSARANWISFPTDCPHRERRGWLGDAQSAAETLMSTFDMSAANVK